MRWPWGMRLLASEYRDLGLIQATSQWKERPISYMLPLTSTIVHAHTNTHTRAHTHAILFFFLRKSLSTKYAKDLLELCCLHTLKGLIFWQAPFYTQ